MFIKKRNGQINSLHPSVTFHTETSHLICSTNQMTGFDMKYKTGLKWVYIHFINLLFFLNPRLQKI